MAEILNFPVRPELPGEYPEAAPDTDETVGSPGVEELAGGAGQGPPGAQGPDLEAEAGAVRRALMTLVLEEREWWRVFERAAAEGQIGLPERAGRLAEELRERNLAGSLPPHVLQDAVETLVPELALDLLPDSPAASWERLLARVRGGGVTYGTPAGAVQRLAAADARYFRRLTRLALRDPDQAALVEVAREVWAELKRQGYHQEPRGFSVYVHAALRDLFPDYPGCGWDSEWAEQVRAKASAALHRHLRAAGLSREGIDISGYVLCLGEAREAEKRGDRVGFREAACRAVAEGRRAVRKASPAAASD